MTRIVAKRRQRRVLKQRRKRRVITAMLMLLVMMVLPQMVNLAFAKKNDEPISRVIVSAGDSVWSIARENAPEGTDIRRLVYEIIEENAIINGEIHAGQELIIPFV